VRRLGREARLIQPKRTPNLDEAPNDDSGCHIPYFCEHLMSLLGLPASRISYIILHCSVAYGTVSSILDRALSVT
jgi:hypothetical protein